MQKELRGPRLGFTLLEVFAAISIIGILMALLFPSLAFAKRRAHRSACLNNLKQLGLGSLLYASDNTRGVFSNTISDKDDNQNWLYPHYIRSLAVFKCAATENSIRSDITQTNVETGARELVDLSKAAYRGKPYGSSYEVYGFMHYNSTSTTSLFYNGEEHQAPGIQKTESTAASYIHENVALQLSGIVPGASQIWLLLDSDPSEGNYPSGFSNHGKSGLNVELCDGHVDWITRRTWLYSYELSQDENRNAVPILP
jgi:prepilin-type N-terminal cleavage/methylation domain-containing protein